MRIAVVNSNFVTIGKNTKKGTEIFAYILIRFLQKQAKRKRLTITAFASGDSRLAVPVESVNYRSSSFDHDIGPEHHKAFELALASKAFGMQKKFDVYHVNIGNGDVILPFAPFVRKPIIVTLHGSFLEERYNKKFLSLFRNLKNIYFVSISNAQRKPLPWLNYIDTVYHGVDIKRRWKFSPAGGEDIVWAGRAIFEKGINDAVRVIKSSGKKAHMYPMMRTESPKWIRNNEKDRAEISKNIIIHYGHDRLGLVAPFQRGKLMLFPIQWEEPFGLVMIEAMACGTPIVAYARGSVPEVVVDGVTGFLINPSKKDIRGNYIIKKSGIEGLREAVKRIYSMPRAEYLSMRRSCRGHVERKFTAEKMASHYIEVYKRALALSRLNRS